MDRHRYQIYLDPEQYEVFRRLAFEERTSIAEQIRRALTAHLGKTLTPALPRRKRPAKGGKRG